MSQWELPTALTVNGKSYTIRTDFRVILDILSALNDPDLCEPDASDEEKNYVQCEVLLKILYEDFDNLPREDWQEAANKGIEFIDCGMKDDGKKKPRLMDWDQDAGLIIPAINKVVGQEVRAMPYMHWWTFFGAYMEIGDSLFSQVVSIRDKKAKHKKLEKYEQDFYKDNKSLIDLKTKTSEEDKKQLASLEKWL